MKKLKLLALLVFVFALSACSLARPERLGGTENQDQFVGVYAVFGERDLDRTNWVEYGSDAIDTNFGRFDFPREVLFAEYDESEHRWIFPGVEGYAAFSTTVDDISTGHEGLNQLSIGYNNNSCTKLEGTIYIEQSDDAYLLTHYNVYETGDGRIYMDGTGNSTGGPASSGGAMSTTKENTYSENGKVVESYEFTVKVNLEPVVPTTSLLLVQYDKKDVELSREELLLEEQHITLEDDAAWMVVVEEDKEGVLHRTAYAPPMDEDDWVAHNFYLPEGDGTIQVYTVSFDVAE